MFFLSRIKYVVALSFKFSLEHSRLKLCELFFQFTFTKCNYFFFVVTMENWGHQISQKLYLQWFAAD